MFLKQSFCILQVKDNTKRQCRPWNFFEATAWTPLQSASPSTRTCVCSRKARYPGRNSNESTSSSRPSCPFPWCSSNSRRVRTRSCSTPSTSSRRPGARSTRTWPRSSSTPYLSVRRPSAASSSTRLEGSPCSLLLGQGWPWAWQL